jgi:hypothetical protein
LQQARQARATPTMCRWFAYIAPTEECLLEDVLITPVSCLYIKLKVHKDSSIAFHLVQ